MVLSEMAGAEDTIYLCNFRVSVDGDWLCLKELAEGGGGTANGEGAHPNLVESCSSSPGTPPSAGANHHFDADHSSCAVPPNYGAGRLAAISGLPPGIFAPYVPLSCGLCTLIITSLLFVDLDPSITINNLTL